MAVSDPRRSVEEYALAWKQLLPRGRAWVQRTVATSTWSRFITGMAEIWSEWVEARAQKLRDVEAYPDTTDELIDDWERVAGIPEICKGPDLFTEDGEPIDQRFGYPGLPFRAGKSRAGARPWRDRDDFLALAQKYLRYYGTKEGYVPPVPDDIDERRRVLVEKLTRVGGQSRAFFIGIANAAGWPDAYIREFSPFRAGVSRCGSSYWRVGSPLQRYHWRMYVGAARVHYFRCGKSRCGRDPLKRYERDRGLECLILELKPAHTKVSFFYSELAGG